MITICSDQSNMKRVKSSRQYGMKLSGTANVKLWSRRYIQPSEFPFLTMLARQPRNYFKTQRIDSLWVKVAFKISKTRNRHLLKLARVQFRKRKIILWTLHPKKQTRHKLWVKCYWRRETMYWAEGPNVNKSTKRSKQSLKWYNRRLKWKCRIQLSFKKVSKVTQIMCLNFLKPKRNWGQETF